MTKTSAAATVTLMLFETVKNKIMFTATVITGEVVIVVFLPSPN